MGSERTLVNPSGSDYLNGLKRNEEIHRYCSIDELYEMLVGKLRLTCPFAWEDPFENPMFRTVLINESGESISIREVGQNLYCQSWTLENESDAMWKLYGRRSTGVCITTTAKELLFQVYNAYDSASNEAVYTKIGKVKYLDEVDVRKLFEADKTFVERFIEPNCEGFYDSLLVKRKAYAYENEVRLTAHDFDGRFGSNATQQLSVSTFGNDWIKQITFGPAVKSDTFEAHRDRLHHLGLPLDKVEVSNLYGPLVYRIDLRRD